MQLAGPLDPYGVSRFQYPIHLSIVTCIITQYVQYENPVVSVNVATKLDHPTHRSRLLACLLTTRHIKVHSHCKQAVIYHMTQATPNIQSISYCVQIQYTDAGLFFSPFGCGGYCHRGVCNYRMQSYSTFMLALH